MAWSISVLYNHSEKQKILGSKPLYETVVVGDEIVHGEG